MSLLDLIRKAAPPAPGAFKNGLPIANALADSSPEPTPREEPPSSLEWTLLDTSRETQPLVLLHIPKTGGTSVAEALKFYYVPEEVLEPVNLTGAYLDGHAHELTGARFLHGHPLGGVLNRLWGRARILTFLRRPGDQAVSNYLHLLSDSSEPLHADAVNLGFGGFLKKHWDQVLFQTTSLLSIGEEPPPESPEEVERRLPEVFATLEAMNFVGVIERAEEASEVLTDLLGLPTPLNLPALNTASSRGASEARIAALRAEYLALRADPALDYLISLQKTVYLKAAALFEQRLQAHRNRVRLRGEAKAIAGRKLAIPAIRFSSDVASFDGDAWRCSLGRSPKTLIYGPYQRLPPGEYAVTFFFDLETPPNTQNGLIHLETAANIETRIGSQIVTVPMAESIEFRTLPFRHERVSDVLEFRIAAWNFKGGSLSFNGVEVRLIGV